MEIYLKVIYKRFKMDDELIKITPNIEKAKSILKMVQTTLEMIKSINISKFSSNVTKEYYDVLRELISVVLLLDGFKTYGEGSHKKLIEYLQLNYNEYEISIIEDLRVKRNKIAYDGFFVQEEYIKSKINEINHIILKLNEIIHNKLKEKI